jgi:hypothetical protein
MRCRDGGAIADGLGRVSVRSAGRVIGPVDLLKITVI